MNNPLLAFSTPARNASSRSAVSGSAIPSRILSSRRHRSGKRQVHTPSSCR
jgi:hypothetical protein